MNLRSSWRRLLLTLGTSVVVISAPILYFLHGGAKSPPCRKELVVQFGKLLDGEYELGVAADGYVNHCRLQVAGGVRRSATCDRVQDVRVVVSAAQFSFPTSSLAIDIDLRRNGNVVLARTFRPQSVSGHNGCPAAAIFVPDVNGDRDLGE